MGTTGLGIIYVHGVRQLFEKGIKEHGTLILNRKRYPELPLVKQ